MQTRKVCNFVILILFHSYMYYPQETRCKVKIFLFVFLCFHVIVVGFIIRVNGIIMLTRGLENIPKLRLYLSIYISLYLSRSISISLSIYLYLNISISIFIYIYI